MEIMDELASTTVSVLKDRRILLGVTGSIAAFKAADLASKLTQAGALVDVVLSPAAVAFISPLTFQSLTGRKAYGERDLWGEEGHVLHVGLAEAADVLVIAPATANTLAKLATGQADTFLTLVALAARCPLVVAPAMDAGMFEHPATQANLKTLRDRGAVIAGPVEGRMASGLIGRGRMEEPGRLMGVIRQVLGREGPLAGKRVVVTAGGTQEPIDPVRVIANRSSGKQGFALAQAAIDFGADVTLISAPTALESPVGVERIDVQTASEMLEATLSACRNAHVLLMAAAVADYRPAKAAAQKIKRREGVPKLKLEPTEDILAAVMKQRAAAGSPKVVVGFAAESKDLIANAQEKLEARGLDIILANDITRADAGFSVDTNKVTLLDRQGEIEDWPLMTKQQVAERLLERVAALLGPDTA